MGHDGRVSGYACDLARYVDDGVTIAVLGNVQSVARDELRRRVAAVVFGEAMDPPTSPPYLEEPGVSLEELAGVYAFGPGFEVSISVAEDRLLARANQGGFSELVPVAGGAWFSRLLYATVRFGRDESGEVDRLLWGVGERAPAGSRVR